MRVIPSFDPSATQDGDIQVGSVDPGAKVLLTNRSNVSVLLNFENGNTDILYGQQANYWTLDGTTPTLQWSQYDVLNAAAPPISKVSGTVYGPEEKIEGVYPAALTNQVSIGNSGGLPVSGTIASSVSNSGNGVPTDVGIAVAANGDTTWHLTNGGLEHLGSANFGAVLDYIFSPNLIGPASGTGSCATYQIFTGNSANTFKMVVLCLTNWKNTGSPILTNLLPNGAFSGPISFWCTDVPGFSLLNPAQVAQSVTYFSGSTGASNISTTTATTIPGGFTSGTFAGSIQYIQFSGSNTSAHSGVMVFMGQ